MRLRIRRAYRLPLLILLLSAFVGLSCDVRPALASAAKAESSAFTPVIVSELEIPEESGHLMRLLHYERGEWTPVRRIESTRPTALLVHGIMDSHLGLSAIAERIADPLYGTAYDVFAVRYFPGNDLERLSLKLRKVIAEATVVNLRATDSSQQFVLIAHSMGGLLARYAIETELSSPINGLVTISSPLNGNLGSLVITSTADTLGLPHTRVMPELDDMKTGSRFITGLNTYGHRNSSCRVLLIAGTNPAGLLFTVVSKYMLMTPNDAVVEQWSAWGLPFRRDGPVSVEDARQNSLLCGRYGECTFESFELNHAQILRHSDVLRAIDSWLRRSQPAE